MPRPHDRFGMCARKASDPSLAPRPGHVSTGVHRVKLIFDNRKRYVMQLAYSLDPRLQPS
jgi:hypothetical protein